MGGFIQGDTNSEIWALESETQLIIIIIINNNLLFIRRNIAVKYLV